MTNANSSTRLKFNGSISQERIRGELINLEALIEFCGIRLGHIVADVPDVPLEMQGELAGIEVALLMARDRVSALDEALEMQGRNEARAA